jgi:predicted metal-binding membrane protein
MAAALETLLRRDAIVVMGALGALILLAWIALLGGAGTGMDPAAMSGWLMPFALPAAFSSQWTPLYWPIAFFMRTVMMVAMMLPPASPMVLLSRASYVGPRARGSQATHPLRSRPLRRVP